MSIVYKVRLHEANFQTRLLLAVTPIPKKNEICEKDQHLGSIFTEILFVVVCDS